MTDIFEKQLDALRRISLSEREKENIRIGLLAHIRENPYAVRQPAWHSSITSVFRSFESSLESRTFLAHPAFAACVLVLCIGVGTSYAAQSALPGQPLYSFKTRVNERVQGSLAFSSADKAQWSAELAIRRVQEAEVLAVTGTLTPVAQADIETGLNTAVQNFNSNVLKLSERDTMEAALAQNNFEASLNAHETLIASLPSSGKSGLLPIATAVKKHVDNITSNRTAAELTITATDSPAVKNAAITQKQSAERAIRKAKQTGQSGKNKAPEIISSVMTIAAEAETDMQAGEEESKNGRWGKALGAYQDAIRKVKESEDSADARSWLLNRVGVKFFGDTSSTSASTTIEIETDTPTTSSSTTMKSSTTIKKIPLIKLEIDD